jgi:hypothetical protein
VVKEWKDIAVVVGKRRSTQRAKDLRRAGPLKDEKLVEQDAVGGSVTKAWVLTMGMKLVRVREAEHVLLTAQIVVA